MESVYLETTIIGHLAGRWHSDPAVAARQRTTRVWWPRACSQYRMLISQLVIDECGGGDSEAAKERLEVIHELELLSINDDVRGLVKELIAARAIPASEPRDAYHVAIAAVHGVQYLVTWNFKHIANAALRGRIESVCRDAGFEPPIICTPDEMAAEQDNEITDG